MRIMTGKISFVRHVLCLAYGLLLGCGCVGQGRLTGSGQTTQSEEELTCWSDYSWGGREIGGLKGFFVEIEKCKNAPLALPLGGDALRMSGVCVHSFEKNSYENVIALEWQIWWDFDDCQLKKAGSRENEVVAGMVAQLAHFPNLKYLTLDFRSDGGALVNLPLNDLANLSSLAHLKITGQGFVVTGLWEHLSKMTALRNLTIEGSPFWSPGPDDEIGSAVLVPTLFGARETKIEELSLRGCILVAQSELKYAKHVRKLVPPIYYCSRGLPPSIEELDTTQSERPSDGYEPLAKLPNLRKIVIFRDDEKAVRRVLEGREVEVLVVPDNHVGRWRCESWEE